MEKARMYVFIIIKAICFYAKKTYVYYGCAGSSYDSFSVGSSQYTKYVLASLSDSDRVNHFHSKISI